MVEIKRYYTLYKLESSGQCKPEKKLELKEFLSNQLSVISTETSDRTLQAHLCKLWRSEHHSDAERQMAELCLRCYISFCLYQWCLSITRKFRHRYPDVERELHQLVLWDDGIQPYRDNKQCLWQKILSTFNPDRMEGSASLSTWVNRLVWQDEETQRTLRFFGYIKYSPWKILSTVNPQHFRKLLTKEFESARLLTKTNIENIQNNSLILEVYQRVYQPDLLQQRRLGNRQYPEPSNEQLQEMIKFLRQDGILIKSEELLHSKLLEIADILKPRQDIKGSEYLNPELSTSSDSCNSDVEDIFFKEFQIRYEEACLEALDQALDNVISWRISRIRSNAAYDARQYLAALDLAHCHQKSLTEIAVVIGRKTQKQVTEMLKLKDLRNAISREMQSILFVRVPNLVNEFTNDEDRLNELNAFIRELIERTVSPIFTEAKSAMQVSPDCRPVTLFAERLCRHLAQRRAS